MKSIGQVANVMSKKKKCLKIESVRQPLYWVLLTALVGKYLTREKIMEVQTLAFSFLN